MVEVLVKNVSNVVPFGSHQHEEAPSVYRLSDVDLVFEHSNFYFNKVAFFDATIIEDPLSTFMERLRDSLSRTLAVFPVLAGRLHKNAANGRLEVILNSKGVPFVEAMVAGDRWPDDLSKLNPITSFLSPAEMFEAAPVRIQVTVLENCRGVALGFGHLHIVMDGYSLVQFLQAWGEVHRELQLSNPPKFEPELMIFRSCSSAAGDREMPKVIDHEEASMVEISESPRSQEPAEDRFASRPKPEFEETDHSAECRSVLPSSDESDSEQKQESQNPEALEDHHGGLEVKYKVFHMSKEVIVQLVKEIDRVRKPTKPTSSYVAISALLWSSICRAREIPDESEVCYTIPISLRGKMRLDPPLPDGFFGNALIMKLAHAPAASRVTKTHISHAAALIQESIAGISPEFAKNHLEWLASFEGKPLPAPIDLKRDVRNTTFTSFPVLEIDFGLGKMTRFRYSLHCLDLADGLTVIVPSGESDGGVDISIALGEDKMQRLLADPDFAAYCCSAHEP